MTRSARAPGKLLLSGAYAVLEGAPAIVCAIDRYARARSGEGHTTAEVRAALHEPCSIDVSELEEGGVKLGLGSSAAALVAALALRAGERGEDVTQAPVRRAIFARAREVHAEVQGGGSGVDVAASTFGGVLRYASSAAEAVALPPGVEIDAFWAGTSARTSSLRERVAALRSRDASVYEARMRALVTIAHAASLAVERGDAGAFVLAIDESLGALSALGGAADAPIVPSAFSELARAARAERAAFAPSGAGGGDIGIFVGTTRPSPSFMERASHIGMKHVALAIDSRGVGLE